MVGPVAFLHDQIWLLFEKSLDMPDPQAVTVRTHHA